MSPTQTAPGWQLQMAGLLTWTAQLVTMGHNNVKAIMWAQPPVDVTPNAKLVLLLMAQRAHDTEPFYYGGISHLMLNMPGPPGANKRRRIMRYLAMLQDAGLISVTDKRDGRRTVYELHLPGLG
jgi:hypothetical protein